MSRLLPRLGLRLVPRLMALTMLALLAWGLAIYPAYRLALTSGLIAYAILLWYRPALWLLVVPALLPVFDLAPWTGWFFFEELDLLLLVTTAVAYWRWGADATETTAADAAAPQPWPISPRLAPAVKPGLILVGCSAAFAAWTGVQPWPPIDANAFSSYLSPYNSLRLAKGFAWAALLLPLMRRHAGADVGQLRRLFIPGMLLGLAGASLAVVWERVVFPGLLNFSSDYRPTAPFSAMHTGGAALDAYLALSFPFVAFWLRGAPSRPRLIAALTLLLLGGYAGLATFSRDVWLAYGCSGLVLLAMALANSHRGGQLDWRKALLSGGLILVAALLLEHVFDSSGYRGMVAALGLLGSAVLLAGMDRTGRMGSIGRIGRRSATAISLISLGTLALLLLVIGVFFFARQHAAPGTDKGAYTAYLLVALVLAAGLLLGRTGGHERLASTLTAAAFPSLMLSTALVADHRGGAAAWPAIGLLIALALALPALRHWHGKPLWHLDQRNIGLALVAAIVMVIAIPLASSDYMGSRYATVSRDLALRLGHWDEALDMMDGGLKTQAFGMGLGRYPATYLWHNRRGEQPPTFSYVSEDGNLFLRLAPPLYQSGYGEVLRILQHIDVQNSENHGAPYRLALDVRRRDATTAMTIAICDRWLLYPQSCTYAPLRLRPGERGWVHYAMPLMVELPAHPSPWLPRAPTQLEISVDGGHGSIDIDNLHLDDLLTGTDLLSNGDFSLANAHWFFSSDHYHFPWHVKNFAVNVVFEMGWCGALAMAVLLVPLALLLVRRAWGSKSAAGDPAAGDPAAGVYLASLAGLMVVGIFDSITDVPRLTLLFGLIIFAAALTPVARPPAR